MKYIEELNFGDTFSYKDQILILTSDFRSNGSRLCYSLNNGQPCWLTNQTIVEHCQVYILDKDNNIIPIKTTNKDNAIN